MNFSSGARIQQLRQQFSQRFSQAISQYCPRFPAWVQLLRLDKPVGSYLLLWPTFWALWAAAEGWPSFANLVIFTLGVFLMRSAGCVINDFADRKIDGHVKRTKDRPLASGIISAKEALLNFAILIAIAFVLVLFTNQTTILLSFAAVFLAALYPFMKRFTNLPQLFLGAAFSMAIPMAFAAESDTLPKVVWLMYLANLSWTVAYDTIYAMVDRDDDLKIGVKSTAILFAELDLAMISILYAITVSCLLMAGGQLELGAIYTLGVLAAAALMAWQVWSIRSREREVCFTVFRQSHWFGAIIWLALVLEYALAG